MKKYFLLLISVIFFSESFSFSVTKPLTQANQIYISIGTKGSKISLLDFSKISVKDYQTISGKHLNFFERISFKSVQRNLRKNINTDGTVDNKLMGKKGFEDSSSGFNIGGFLLGLFLFLPGVLIAYLIGGDEDARRSRVKWAWYGAGLFVAIALAFYRSYGI